jgi:uncharacterized protein (TIGR02646 family)
MRQIQRLLLGPRAIGILHERSTRVQKAAAPKQEAARLWGLRSNKTFHEINDVLEQMSLGRRRCMYCEDNEGTDIDHFWPKSTYPERAFDWDNYLLACSGCNSNYKRDQFPTKHGKPILLDPTTDDPMEHMVLVPETGEFVDLTPRGAKSIAVFGLTRETLQRGRALAWALAEQLISAFARHKRDGDIAKAKAIQTLVPDLSFASIWIHVLKAASDTADTRVNQETKDAVRDYPEILEWPEF